MGEHTPLNGSLRTNLAWGTKWGLGFAAGFTLLSAVPAVIRALVGTDIWWQKGLSFLSIVGVYVFSGILGGIIVGLLRGILRWWWGRRLVGAIIGVPFGFAVRTMVHGWSGPADLHIWLIAGAAWGVMMSFIPEPDAQKNWPRKHRGR